MAAKRITADRSVRALAGRVKLRIAAELRLIIPLIAVILKVRIEAFEVDAGKVVKLVIGRACVAPTVAIVTVFADGVVVIDRLGERGFWIDSRLPVVDAAAIVVERSAKEEAKLPVPSEAMADGPAVFGILAATEDGIVAAEAKEVDRRELAGGFGFHINRSADTVAIHIGRQGFIHFDGLHEIGGKHV